MALRGEAAGIIYRSAVAMIRSTAGSLTEYRLAQRLSTVLRSESIHPMSDYRQAARAALRSVAAGQSVERRGGANLPLSLLPRVPGDYGPTDRASYRALVTVRSNVTGDEVRYAADLYSHDVRSFQSLDEYVRDRYAVLSYRTTTRADIARLGADVSVATTILAAGRL